MHRFNGTVVDMHRIRERFVMKLCAFYMLECGPLYLHHVTLQQCMECTRTQQPTESCTQHEACIATAHLEKHVFMGTALLHAMLEP